MRNVLTVKYKLISRISAHWPSVNEKVAVIAKYFTKGARLDVICFQQLIFLAVSSKFQQLVNLASITSAVNDTCLSWHYILALAEGPFSACSICCHTIARQNVDPVLTLFLQHVDVEAGILDLIERLEVTVDGVFRPVTEHLGQHIAENC